MDELTRAQRRHAVLEDLRRVRRPRLVQLITATALAAAVNRAYRAGAVRE
jgi:hypothetical protein